VALWRQPTVSEETGLARSTIYKKVAEGEFPPPVRLTSNTVAWRSEEVEEWIRARPVAESVQGPHRDATEAEGAR
jgi:prophage regulatory protein